MGGRTRQGERFDFRRRCAVSPDSLPRHVTDLASSITNYKAYLSFISTLMVLLARGNGEKHLQTARQTLGDLAKRFGNQERAPLLACLEINRRLREAQVEVEASSEDHGDETLLHSYWTDFGHKGSVLDDLGPYVTAQSDFAATLRGILGVEAVSACTIGRDTC